jgi:MFS family permease
MPEPAPKDLRPVQRRILWTLVLTQVIGGVGVAIGLSVGALLGAAMGGVQISGLSQSFLVIGAALIALPVTRLMRATGRRPGLVLAYATGAAGAVLVVLASTWNSVPLLCAGFFLFGGGSAANYQARYAAVDLAHPSRRGRQLSFVVWATTIGAVSGPILASMADTVGHRFSSARYIGPFVFSVAAFTLAAVAVAALLRPDPLRLARTLEGHLASPGPAARASQASAGIRAALAEVSGSPEARLGMAAVAVGHLVMVGVMAMTPVHIGDLRTVGIVLSLHIGGMYAFSPVTGWLTDRVGRRPVILGGIGLLLAACAVAGLAGHDTPRLALGLVLLGMGWSATMVAGSTLLTESVGVANRASVQGLSDLVMGIAAALAGALSGPVVAYLTYPALTLLAAVATVPLIALALRPTRETG